MDSNIEILVKATNPSTVLEGKNVKIKKDRRHCCVPHCTKTGTRVENGRKVTFHSFPSDPKRRQQWVVKIKRDINNTFKISAGTVVCSLHFKDEDYRYTGGYSNRCYLKEDAVPSVFDCWLNLDKKYVYTPAKERRPNKWMSRKVSAPGQVNCALESDALSENDTDTDSISSSDSFSETTAPIHDDVSNTSTAQTTPVKNQVDETRLNIEFSKLKLESSLLNRTLEAIKIQLEENKSVNKHLSASIKLLQDRTAELEDDLLERDETIKKLQNELAKSKSELSTAHETISKDVFSIDNLPPRDVTFYTGLPEIKDFDRLLVGLETGSSGENIVYSTSVNNAGVKSNSSHVKRGRPRLLTPRQEFFMFLCRVRLGLFEQDLAYRFKVSKSTVSAILISWTVYLYERLGQINIWPSRQLIDENMPENFKAAYPNTRVIIDCTEIQMETPSSLVLQSKSYSTYKSGNTLKSLIGITPGGHLSFISSLYLGSISDREITMRSGLLNLPFDEGDSVMADKGFDIQDLLDPMGVKLNLPAYVGKRDQMTKGEVRETQQIASLRIHIERWNNKLKNFHIWDRPALLSTAGSVNLTWTVCGLLTLFQDPILSTESYDS